MHLALNNSMRNELEGFFNDSFPLPKIEIRKNKGNTYLQPASNDDMRLSFISEKNKTAYLKLPQR